MEQQKQSTNSQETQPVQNKVVKTSAQQQNTQGQTPQTSPQGTQLIQGQTQPINEKKIKGWMWVIIGVVVIFILVGVYFWLF